MSNSSSVILLSLAFQVFFFERASIFYFVFFLSFRELFNRFSSASKSQPLQSLLITHEVFHNRATRYFYEKLINFSFYNISNLTVNIKSSQEHKRNIIIFHTKFAKKLKTNTSLVFKKIMQYE